MKDKGNDLFSSQNFGQACQVYYEAILEIEELIDNGTKRNDELNNLETTLKLNYATGKLRLK